MGLVHINSTIRGHGETGTPYRGRFLADTGSVDCVVPRNDLLAAGVTPAGKENYILASGEHVPYEYGFAWVSLLDSETIVQVVFGEPQAEPILGVVAWENMGYTVDPVNRRVDKSPGKPLKYRRRIT